MRGEAKTIDEYVARLEPIRQEAIESLRFLILKHNPDINQSMDFGMPVFRFGDGKFDFVALASQKQYISFYVNPEVLARHKSKFKDFNLGRSCIRFKRLGQLPMEDIELLLKDAPFVSRVSSDYTPAAVRRFAGPSCVPGTRRARSQVLTSP